MQEKFQLCTLTHCVNSSDQSLEMKFRSSKPLGEDCMVIDDCELKKQREITVPCCGGFLMSLRSMGDSSKHVHSVLEGFRSQLEVTRVFRRN